MTRVALDSNILVYVAGIERAEGDAVKVDRARALFGALGNLATLVAPVQALGELFVVMRRNATSLTDAHAVMATFSDACETPASDIAAVETALRLVADHQLQYWDALILSVAAEARCTLLLSEDMQHGFATRGVTIINPLAEVAHPKLAALIGGAGRD